MTTLHDSLAAASADGRILKGHGTGNDFVVVIDMADDIALDPDVVRALCHRHFGIGADGVIRITGAVPGDVGDDIARAVADAPVFMDYRNGDGTIVEMCGNGVRVVAKVVHDHGIVELAGDGLLDIGTRSGLRPVQVMGDAIGEAAPQPPEDAGTQAPEDAGRQAPEDARPHLVITHVTVDMGAPVQDADAIGLQPGSFEGDVARFRLRGDDAIPSTTTFAGMSMGNPHAVTVVDSVTAVPLDRLGPAVEAHAAFADGVNVNVVEVVDDATLRLRVWERGVGETQACGTGACATVAAMARAGHVDATRPVDVEVGGGTLRIERDGRGHLLMTGPAEVVGTVHLDAGWLAARLGNAAGQ